MACQRDTAITRADPVTVARAIGRFVHGSANAQVAVARFHRGRFAGNGAGG